MGEIQQNQKCSRPRSRLLYRSQPPEGWMEFSHPNDKTNECVFHRINVLYLFNTYNFQIGSMYFSLWYDSVLSLIAELL